MFKLISGQKKGSVMFKLIPFLIFVFLFATSCESIKKKFIQSEDTPASRSLAGLTKPSAGISGTQLNQLKRRERDILSRIRREKGSLKVAYSFLANEKTKRICYVESFKTRDIVPRFAQPISYEEARLFKKPPVPKCSGQEYSMISSYQNASILTDEKGLQVAGLPLVPIMGAAAGTAGRQLVKRAVVGVAGYGVPGLGGLSVCAVVHDQMAGAKDNTLATLLSGLFVLGLGPFSLGLAADMGTLRNTTAFMVGCAIGAGGMSIYHAVVQPETTFFFPDREIKEQDISVP